MAVSKWDKKTKEKIRKSMLEYNKCVRRKLEMSDSKCGNEGKKMKIKEEKMGELRRRRDKYFSRGYFYENESIIGKEELIRDLRQLGLSKELYDSNKRMKSKTELFKIYSNFIKKNKGKIKDNKNIEKMKKEYIKASNNFEELRNDKYLMRNLKKNIKTKKQGEALKNKIERLDKSIKKYNNEYNRSNIYAFNNDIREISKEYVNISNRIQNNIKKLNLK
tara:strand:+ start:212 stop:871 length:660 start_codon:yes stop_codon:yes gene_type:complete